MKARTKKTGNLVHHAYVESQWDKNEGTKFLVSLFCKFRLMKLHQSHVRVFTQSPLYLHSRVVMSGNFALVGSCQLNSIQFRGSITKRLTHSLSHRLYDEVFNSLKEGIILVTRWSV